MLEIVLVEVMLAGLPLGALWNWLVFVCLFFCVCRVCSMVYYVINACIDVLSMHVCLGVRELQVPFSVVHPNTRQC